jgi:ABC-type uncharacterized transport system ATPase subunit
MEPFVELHDITLAYGDILVLYRVNFRIYPAQVHALIGEHSAGKTSVAHILSGLVKPISGHILFGRRRRFPLFLLNKLKSMAFASSLRKTACLQD